MFLKMFVFIYFSYFEVKIDISNMINEFMKGKLSKPGCLQLS